ncbi:MAG: glycosyltransferase family 2 protein [candidate division Zixibacteria bacterium]|nr:glycosyltransferase family 2 protein [candidate division Zixibacteria bacterium]
MPSLPALCVVIPTYNRPAFLARLLESLADQDVAPDHFEVLVVSDGSTDHTHEYLEAFCCTHTNFRWMVQKNQGPAAARNTGLAVATTDCIAFTDDDCIAAPDWVRHILRCFKEQPDVLGMEGKTVTQHELRTPFTHYVEGNGECYASCNVAYRRQALTELGGFDTRFFYGNEDVDLAWRMMQRGRMVFNEKMVILHPPVPRSFLKFVRHPETYGVEILLYRNHPQRYLQTKKHNPLHVIFISIGLRYLPGQIASSLRMSGRRPVEFVNALAGLALQRVWLLCLAPRMLALYFGVIKKNRSYV